MTTKSSKTSSASTQSKESEKEYNVKVYPEFKKDREAWSDDDNKKINEAITALRKAPRGQNCKKLKGNSGNYRARVGNFRILYSINEAEIIVYVIKVDDRKDIYR